MSIVDKLDAWVVGKHQEIIDWSQKNPAWWVEHSGFALGACAIVMCAVPADAWKVAVCLFGDLAIAAFTVFAARSDVLMRILAGKGIYRLIALITCLALLPSVLHRHPHGWPLWLVHDVIIVSSIYFAACQPPRPREKKDSRLAPSST